MMSPCELNKWEKAMKNTQILAKIAVVVLVFIAVNANAAVREYWIAADEVVWDYMPSYPVNLMTGQELADEKKVFVENIPGQLIGRQYIKAIYRQYTADWQLIRRTPEEQLHLGTLGPVIYAAVGDDIIVHFRNNTRYPVSVHPHGVFYDKSSEGAPYTDSADDLTNTAAGDDAVAPGGQWDYFWGVPRRAGPGPNDPSSIAWLYHSHTDETADTNAGLVGVMVITERGKADRNGRPRGIDREFFSLYTVFDENSSIFLDDNLAEFGGNPDNADFEESNLMHGINGLLWGNNKYTMRVGEKVRWYIMAMGTEVDLHTPHWHGVTLLHNGNRIDVTEVLPAATKTLDMQPDNPGTWMFHCHVNDHLEAGMMAKFTAIP
jgi:FtsP/CotA-like multicopper oxidase with cupredoxin domain